MQSHTCILSVLTLSTSMGFGAATMAADLPKEGSFTATYVGRISFQSWTTVKDQTFGIFDNRATSVGNGLFDHVAWRCMGTEMVQSGTGPLHAFCVASDPAGDQIVVEIPTVEFPVGKSGRFSGKFIGGTGKYSGITGGYTCTDQSTDYRTETEGSTVLAGTCQGSYKL
jgi:hypothetical protein